MSKEEELKSGWGAGFSHPTHRQHEIGNHVPLPPSKSLNAFAEGRRRGLKKDFGQADLHSKSRSGALLAQVPSVLSLCISPVRLLFSIAGVLGGFGSRWPRLSQEPSSAVGCAGLSEPHAALITASTVLSSSPCPTSVIFMC